MKKLRAYKLDLLPFAEQTDTSFKILGSIMLGLTLLWVDDVRSVLKKVLIFI